MTGARRKICSLCDRPLGGNRLRQHRASVQTPNPAESPEPPPPRPGRRIATGQVEEGPGFIRHTILVDDDPTPA